MANKVLKIYNTILASLSTQDMRDQTRPFEMENLCKKISKFIQSLEPQDVHCASRNIELLIYTHYQETEACITRIPYRGREEKQEIELIFDLKNFPPLLLRVISRYIDIAFEV